MSDVEAEYGAAAAEVGSKRAAGRLSGAERGEAPAARGVKKARLAQFLAMVVFSRAAAICRLEWLTRRSSCREHLIYKGEVGRPGRGWPLRIRCRR